MEISEVEARTEDKIETRNYLVDNIPIEVKAKRFLLQEDSLKVEENSTSGMATIVLPGWSANLGGKSVELLGQAFADQSGITYAITTRAEQVIPNSLYKESQAIVKLIQEKGIKRVILAGNSQGGDKAINVAVILQELSKQDPEIQVEGVILMDSTGLYEQGKGELAGKFAADSLLGTPKTSGAAFFRRLGEGIRYRTFFRKFAPDLLSKAIQAGKVVDSGAVGLDVFLGIVKEMGRSRLEYPKRIINEIREMGAINPRMSEVTAPIILVQGSMDPVSSPEKITPSRDVPTPDLREEYLKANLFKSSPAVKMVVAKRVGHHGVPLFRAESVAKVSTYLLHRLHRLNKHLPPQNTA
ncbi:MAG: hypothetical protein UU73_C0002G0029 [Candidatus Daviesbacteria bacterium GW2011_GWA1_41_61]|uniref:Alpha/beta hydrolase n=1 Tax=Candidatus Daviesbacteria bacterium GW2011_GWA2_40_9 TaxID=1618424 RepID=A0A0G0U903_9BACT|nr:MAG: hypothetical protein UU26_C0008G0004 [Candidatus Daviesbacteria bacterium GW2011_GWC1_40_9]KKR83716.1 MAG: hypothetical protein UU29_C0002G0029 [Candidatus Daviesbacteria bacterium GW2011_GWA2_40_9]KKR93689.1 MAG: hypothetical protein UU44_C0001G0029 [Candidatus Daviesbacteria bacterium GW2011_GWB1_41_15]KKS15155.1 MAG: hypothetical protein UU73_C0002G0029 [Candidatus Daviesbacteria bacterium GW2011_GWA1_41_61]